MIIYSDENETQAVTYFDELNLSACRKMVAKFGTGDISFFQCLSENVPSIGLRDATQMREIGSKADERLPICNPPIVLSFAAKESLTAFIAELSDLEANWETFNVEV